MSSLRIRLSLGVSLFSGFRRDGSRLVPAASQKAFPFDAELRLEAKPQPGSKRVPWLQFSESGTVEIDLWCASGRGQAVIVDQTDHDRADGFARQPIARRTAC